jgi:hypothetical protein
LLAAALVLVIAGLGYLLWWSRSTSDATRSSAVAVPTTVENARDVSAPVKETHDASSSAREVLASELPSSWSIRVLDAETRQAVDGARVELSAGSWRVEGTTRADGTLALGSDERSSAREADLFVDHPSFVPARVPAVKAGEARDVLVRRGGEIVGRCQPPPTSAANVSVFEQISQDSTNWKARVAPTDSSGKFRVAQLTPGDYSITAAVDGWIAPTLHSVRVKAGDTREVTLSLMPETILSGRLLLPESSLPVVGASVSISGLGDPALVELAPRRSPDGRRAAQDAALASLAASVARDAITDANGRFELRGLSATSYSLRFRMCDHSSFVLPLSVNQSGGRIEQDFTAPAELHLHGHVVDSEGKPVADAIVGVVDDREWWTIAKDIQHFKAAEHPSARSQSDGSFAIDLRADRLRSFYLVYRAPESMNADPSWKIDPVFRAQHEEDHDELDVTLTIANLRPLAGTVKDERGAGVVGALVELSEHGVIGSTTSGADGSFTIAAPVYKNGGVSGDARLTARGPGFTSGDVRVSSTKNVELIVHPVHTITGEVLDLDGRAVPNILIVLGTPLPDHKRGPKPGGGDFPTHTDEFGRFRFPDVVCMDSEVGFDPRVQPEWVMESRSPAVIPASGDQVVTVVARHVVADERARLKGRLVAKGVDSITDLRMEVIPQKRGSTEPNYGAAQSRDAKLNGILARTGDEFTLENVDPGAGVLKVSCKGCRDVSRLVELRSGETLDIGEIELVHSTQLTVAFKDANDRPISGATAELVPLDGGEGAARSFKLTDGVVFMDAVCGRSYELRVHRAGHETYVQRVEVPSDQKFGTPFTLTIRLE